MTSVPAAARRLTRRSEFLAAAAGRRFHTPRMTVQGIMRTSAADSGAGMRVGFTVTKRVGNAPERNRIRRRLRAAVDLASTSWPAASLDLVLIARREAISAPFDQLVDDLRNAAPALASGKGAAAPKSSRNGGRRRGKGSARPNGAARGAGNDVHEKTDKSP